MRQIQGDVARHRLAGSVRWLGAVSDLAGLYRQHDVIVIPRASEERMGFPLRLIEALSYGRPVVVSDIGEMPVVAAGCGIVFPRRDADRLAAALDALLGDVALYRRCARQAYHTAARYASAGTVPRLIELYEELAAGPS